MSKYFDIVFACFAMVFFPLRDFLCWTLYPLMKTNVKEWDGANNLTMDLFSSMFFCLSIISWKHTSGVLSVIMAIVLGFSAGDILDRIFGIREYTRFDLFSVPLAIIIPIYTYVRNRKCSQ